jgi:tetratricopeptide (TPR) repeat protein
MRLRPGRLRMSLLICLGCHSLAGQPAIAHRQDSAEDTGKSHLSLAAECLEKGDDRTACEHLGLFLQTHPEHRNARFYHAELLLKLGRHQLARDQFELAIRHEQDEREPDLRHMVQCHTRLAEIGEAQGAAYLVHLHRGIGMLLLARQRAALDDPDGELSTEALLCKAAAQLSRARALRPSEARPSWYLHLAWRQLAQHAAARRWLAEAQRQAPFSHLSPAEYRDLQLACRERLL